MVLPQADPGLWALVSSPGCEGAGPLPRDSLLHHRSCPACPAGEVLYMSDAHSHRVQEKGVLTVREAADQGYENMGRSRGGSIG